MACSKKEIGTGFITEVDRYLYGEGTHYEIYEKLGAHPKDHHGKKGMYFAVWAPHAVSVSVVWRFQWLESRCFSDGSPGSSGIYEVLIPGLGIGNFGITQLPQPPEKSCLRRIRLLSKQNTAREPLPLPPTFPVFPGKTAPG